MKSLVLQKDGHFRLVPHRPGRRALMLGLLLLTVCAVGALGYWYGRSRATLDAEYLDALVRRDQVSEERVAALRRQLVDAELARSVDQQAAESLRVTITALRDEIAELREEAALYRNMLDPGATVAQLRIADFELTATASAGQFHYHLLLTRSDVEADPARGLVELQIAGVSTTGGMRRQRALSLKEVSDVSTYPVPYRFRYFQGVAGIMTLPADFEPTKVLIKLTPAGRRGDAVRREFEWRPEPG